MRSLLYERSPADASAAYYAFHHPDDRTQLFTLTDPAGVAAGYLCLSRTGMDLFRPLLTIRLPLSAVGDGPDPHSALALIYTALPAGSDVIVSAPQAYHPIISALFEIQSEQELHLMALDRTRFKPVINVLVTESETYNSLPRFVARTNAGSETHESHEIAASAGLNWRSPEFAEIYVHTKAAHRRRGFGRSVVAAVVQNTLESGRTPLYAVGAGNEASIQLAESVGFVSTGLVNTLFEATLKPRPF